MCQYMHVYMWHQSCMHACICLRVFVCASVRFCVLPPAATQRERTLHLCVWDTFCPIVFVFRVNSRRTGFTSNLQHRKIMFIKPRRQRKVCNYPKSGDQAVLDVHNSSDHPCSMFEEISDSRQQNLETREALEQRQSHNTT